DLPGAVLGGADAEHDLHVARVVLGEHVPHGGLEVALLVQYGHDNGYGGPAHRAPHGSPGVVPYGWTVQRYCNRVKGPAIRGQNPGRPRRVPSGTTRRGRHGRPIGGLDDNLGTAAGGRSSGAGGHPVGERRGDDGYGQDGGAGAEFRRVRSSPTPPDRGGPARGGPRRPLTPAPAVRRRRVTLL